MGAYAYIDNKEVKFSGHLADVGRLNGFHLENGTLFLSYANVSYIVIELAKRVNRIDVLRITQAGDVQGLRRLSRALADIESLLYWLSDNSTLSKLMFT